MVGAGAHSGFITLGRSLFGMMFNSSAYRIPKNRKFSLLRVQRSTLPLYADGLKKIRRSMEMASQGQRTWHEKIGAFTPEQLTALNNLRVGEGFPPVEAVIVCNGKHLWDSRCIKDSYSIDEVIAQIELAFDLVKHPARDRWATVLKSDRQPPDGSGNRITYEMVFECTSKHQNASLFSVIPRGDGRGPGAKRNPLEEGVSAKL